MTSNKNEDQKLLQTDCHIGIIGSGLGGLSVALAILRGAATCDDHRHRREKKKTRKNITKATDYGETGSSAQGLLLRQKEERYCFQGRISIYERDLHMSDRKEGYGMTLTYDPSGPLAKLGILDAVANRNCPSRCHYIFNEKGVVRGYFGRAFYDGDEIDRGAEDTRKEDESECPNEEYAMREPGQRGNIRIPRSELRSILMTELMKEDAKMGPTKIFLRWGKRLLSYVDRPALEKLNHVYNNPFRGEDVGTNSGSTSELQWQHQQQRPVLLYFEDGTSDSVDLLIGADGVNSVVAKQYLSTSVPAKHIIDNQTISLGHNEDSFKLEFMDKKCSEQKSTNDIAHVPDYLGIFVILGISHHFHPLIDERGYYTLDGFHRLFIMPFQGSRLADRQHSDNPQNLLTTPSPKRRTMWQLSYPVASKEEAMKMSSLSRGDLRREVLNRCGHWHQPFPDMVKDTPLTTIWGAGLLDRDPNVFIEHRQRLEIHGRVPSHVVLVGDAAHAMSPFKGQGANQSLADGPLLAKWLSQCKFHSAVRGYMAEMARRSGVKVRASREAAIKLHSKDCWEWMVMQEKAIHKNATAIFHGVQAEHVDSLLNILRMRSVDASLSDKLDNSIRSIIKEMNVSETR